MNNEGPAVFFFAVAVLFVGICLNADCQCNRRPDPPPPPPTRAPLTTEDVGRAAGKHAVKFGKGFVEGAKSATKE